MPLTTSTERLFISIKIMEKEKIIEALVTDDINRGVKFYYDSETGYRELRDIKDIAQKILEMDSQLIIDNSHARSPPVN